MAYHYSNTLSPMRSAAPTVDNLSSRLSHDLRIYETARTETTVQCTEHETERGGRWSALRPPSLPANLRERVKTGLRAVRAATGPHVRPIPHDRPEAAFSAIEASSSSHGRRGARLFLAHMPPDAPPPTVVWASQGQGVAWGQWPCHSFTHCITVLTERSARALYDIALDDDDAPLPPVNACALDGVAHLWIIVPPRHAGAARGRSVLSDEQMRAAVEFADAAAGGDSPGQMLLACAEGSEVDVAALAVLLLARAGGSTRPAASAGHDAFPDRRGRSQRRGEQRALEGCAQTYQAARLLDDDVGVSLVWKGLLGWQDVERVQAVLWTCDQGGV